MGIFEKMSLDERKFWYEKCDPGIYLAHTRMPIMFVTGTNDFAYPLDSLKKSYSASRKIAAAHLIYTKDTEAWQNRKWLLAEATLTDIRISGQIPPDTTVCYLALETADGLLVSSRHNEI